jgi:aspartate-semialdehyde dehydrogenase
MAKIAVGVIGATGMVGQNYLRLLEGHPWFEVTHVAASAGSAGKYYKEAVANRWLMPTPIPEAVRNLTVQDANSIVDVEKKCRLVFSAVSMEKSAVTRFELDYAEKGLAVVSNNSAHRGTPDVPMIIPEINGNHLEVIDQQRQTRGWDKGLLAVKSNCSVQSYMTPVYALIAAGYPVSRMIITTLQGLSGAGYPGPSALDLVDNTIPYIKAEEKKSEIEPLKLLGKVDGATIINADAPKIAAHCNRVPVIDGHTACVSLAFDGSRPDLEETKQIWEQFTGLPQELKLPLAPLPPILYCSENDRPQPRKDRDRGQGMAVTVGRLRPCNVFDIRFVGLHHNTVRGAAGGAILTAELLKAKGYLS